MPLLFFSIPLIYFAPEKVVFILSNYFEIIKIRVFPNAVRICLLGDDQGCTNCPWLIKELDKCTWFNQANSSSMPTKYKVLL